MTPDDGDVIYTNTEVHLDWGDRFKVLLGRPLHVDVQTSTEHKPGWTRATSKVWVERFVAPWEYRGGYAEEPAPR